MASASSQHQPLQCTLDSLLNDQNTRCVPDRPVTALPNNTSSARQGRVGGDQCDCLCWGKVDDSRGASATMASASSHHRGIQCTQDSLLNDQNLRCIPARPMTALPNNTSSARQGRVGGDQCDCLCWGKADDSRGARRPTGERHPTQCSQESVLGTHSRMSLEPTA